MQLSELVKHLPPDMIKKRRGRQSVRISGLAYDSRRVARGNLFACWSGFRFDGHDFAREAVRRGAIAVMTERWLPGLDAIQLVVRDGREALAHMSAAFYGYPSRRLRLIGVTGTNGKTTTTYLIKAILEAAGHRVGLIGTIQYMIGQQVLEAQHTTPESVDLQALLARMVEAGVTHCVMEVSSHAVALKRTLMCEFGVGVFTNITQDHLDFHPDFAHYVRTKAKFFAQLDPAQAAALAIVNGDDAHVDDIVASCRVPIKYYGLVHRGDYRAQNVRTEPTGVTYTADTPRGSFPLRLSLAGQFNIYNSLAAVAVADWAGVDANVIREGLESVTGVPGRFERVDLGQPFTVLVDYAHTPDSLENILRAARPFTENHLWVVFGCGGDRDRSKRPLMGGVAARLADHVVITSDNPRSENPQAICKEILHGALASDGSAVSPPTGRIPSSNESPAEPSSAGMPSVEVVVERREAIAYAVSRARPGDTIVIAGKGHETYQIFGDRTIHFDDREEAAAAIRERMVHEAGLR